MFLELLGISDALAEAAKTAATTSGTEATTQGGFLSMLPMLIIFFVVFYFLLVRPQTKRAKEQRNLMANLAVGDEVMTSGGIIAKVTKLSDTQVTVVTASNTELLMQKNAVVNILPKGSISSMK
ncbi:MAG TPA: preprotein translocase subunit YajC [Coxiellaceae bacterium]|nr:preprotein translocase subunit YajC [Coxiellaceae bacterium]